MVCRNMLCFLMAVLLLLLPIKKKNNGVVEFVKVGINCS